MLLHLFIIDITSVFKYSQFLMYTDNMTFYSTVTTERNHLQEDLNNLVRYCDSNVLYLDFNKFEVWNFYTCLSPLVNICAIDNVNIELVETYNDLDVIFMLSLSVNCLIIENVVLRGYQWIGFLQRNRKHVCDPRILLTLVASYRAIQNTYLPQEHC